MAKNKKIAISVSDAFFSEMDARVPLHVSSVIVDREAGASFVDTVFSESVNLEFITHRMRAKDENSEDLRERVALALMSNGMSKVFMHVVQGATMRKDGLQGTKTEVISACEAAGYSGDLGLVMAELAIPALIANNLVSDKARFGVRRKVGYKAVTVKDLAEDLLKQEIARAINEAKRVFQIPAGTHSTRAVAEEFGDAYRAVGIALATINDYERVLNDMVLGVLANIDPAPLETQRGSVSPFLRNHAVVQQLTTNWNFILEALRLRSEVSGLEGASRGVTIESEEWVFDKHAPVILAMLRNSDRYAMISKSEFVATIGICKIFDLEGRPVSSVIYDNARMEAAAMIVTAVDDVSMEGALSLTEMPERVSERMMSAYGDIAKQSSVPMAARMLADVVQLAVDEQESVEPLYMCRLESSKVSLDAETIAAMLCPSLSARFNINPEAGSAYTFVFSGETKHRSLRLVKGSINATTFFTPDPAEAFLAMDEVEPRREMDIPAQLIPRHALNCRLLGYTSDDFVRAKERAGYKLDAYGINITGVVRLRELTSIRLGELATLVVPFHNSQVFDLVNTIAVQAWEIATAVGQPNVQRRAKRYVAQFALAAAQAIVPGFRSEIHSSIIEHAASKLNVEDSIQMRAKLRQQAVTVFADVLALTIFLRLQGIAGEDLFVSKLMEEQDVLDFWTETGSDRHG